MKIEIGKEFPQYFKALYPEEFELFSHFETTSCSILHYRIGAFASAFFLFAFFYFLPFP